MIEVTSLFPQDGAIPSKYTCDGLGISPPLKWSAVPERTRSIAMLVDDPDSPDHPFLHWLVADLDRNDACPLRPRPALGVAIIGAGARATEQLGAAIRSELASRLAIPQRDRGRNLNVACN